MNLTETIIYLIASVGGVFLAFLIFLWRKSRKNKSASAKSRPPTTSNFANRLRAVFSGNAAEKNQILAEAEDILISADVGALLAEEIIAGVRAKNADAQNLWPELKAEIRAHLTPRTPATAPLSGASPEVIYLVGVNGVGKTTTIGKLARQFKAQGKSVLLVAADTFRAAAVEQLKIWADRNGVDCIAGASEADPTSVIVNGLRAGKARGVDIVLVDTAGRLHTKTNLMDELRKMVRACEKETGAPPRDIWLVLDAVTGQNGLSQAKTFWDAVKITGVVLTKYDATSKGGVILAVVKELDVPIRYLGLGEGPDDLIAFDPDLFLRKMFGE